MSFYAFLRQATQRMNVILLARGSCILWSSGSRSVGTRA